jgi:hypothetical protein
LVADQSGANYQWIDCNDSSPISGETNGILEPEDNGDYAVEITLDGCTSTSKCHSFQVASIKNEVNNTLFTLYPNPSNSYINIESELSYKLEVFDSKGSVVYDN